MFYGRPLNTTEEFKKYYLKEQTAEFVQSQECKGLNAPIPTLNEVLDILKQAKNPDFIINLELKEYTPKAIPIVLDLLIEKNLLERSYLASFRRRHKQVLHEELQKRNLPKMPFGRLSEQPGNLDVDRMISEFVPGDMVTVERKTLFKEFDHFFKPDLERLRAAGFKIGMWYSAGDPIESVEDYKLLIEEKGVNYFILNSIAGVGDFKAQQGN